MAAKFVDVSESEIDQFKENAVPQKTKEATNHQCNSTKTISRLRRPEYRRIVDIRQYSPIFTSPSATKCLLLFSINLLAFYHQRRSLIGYATHYLLSN